MAYNNGNDLDILAVISVLLGMVNVQENRLQSAQNDVQSANDKQAQFLLNEINKKFDEQNEILNKIQKALDKMNGR